MKKRTYNKTQETYMLAKANLETLENREKELERQYITDSGIKNPDGTTPERIYCIEDEVAFDKANKETAELSEVTGLWAEILEARQIMKATEENLIKYGLSLAPTREREILTKASKSNYTTRQKIIDLVFRLDASTVRA